MAAGIKKKKERKKEKAQSETGINLKMFQRVTSRDGARVTFTLKRCGCWNTGCARFAVDRTGQHRPRCPLTVVQRRSNVGVVPPKTRECVYLTNGWKGWDGGGGGKATALFRKRAVPGVHLERGQNRD